MDALMLTVAELAARWECTPRQVFELARFQKLLLYFPFDGEAYDVLDEKRRVHAEWKNAQEVDRLSHAIESIDKRLSCSKDELSPWEEPLTSGSAEALRGQRQKASARLQVLEIMARYIAKTREQSQFLGYLIASPETVELCEKDGFAPFPAVAYHPSHPVKLKPVSGAMYGILDGRMLRLGPRRNNQSSLGPDDLRVQLTDITAAETVKAIRGEKTRTNELDPLIERAISIATSAKCAAVWTALKELALQNTPPFTGEVDGKKGLAYTKEGEVVYLTKDALRTRLNRRAERREA